VETGHDSRKQCFAGEPLNESVYWPLCGRGRVDRDRTARRSFRLLPEWEPGNGRPAGEMTVEVAKYRWRRASDRASLNQVRAPRDSYHCYGLGLGRVVRVDPVVQDDAVDGLTSLGWYIFHALSGLLAIGRTRLVIPLASNCTPPDGDGHRPQFHSFFDHRISSRKPGNRVHRG